MENENFNPPLPNQLKKVSPEFSRKPLKSSSHRTITSSISGIFSLLDSVWWLQDQFGELFNIYRCLRLGELSTMHWSISSWALGCQQMLSSVTIGCLISRTHYNTKRLQTFDKFQDCNSRTLIEQLVHKDPLSVMCSGALSGFPSRWGLSPPFWSYPML